MLKTLLASVAIVMAPMSATASATIQTAGAALDPGAGEIDLLSASQDWRCEDRSPWSHGDAPTVILLTGSAASSDDLSGNELVFPAAFSAPTATLGGGALFASPPFDLGEIATEQIAEPGAIALLGLAVIGLAVAWAARRARRLWKAGT